MYLVPEIKGYLETAIERPTFMATIYEIYFILFQIFGLWPSSEIEHNSQSGTHLCLKKVSNVDTPTPPGQFTKWHPSLILESK